MEYRAIERFLKNGKGILFAYDHGFEYGPASFDERSSEPSFALELADSGSFTGFICQKGIAARYYNSSVHQVPLIVKLNGRTSFRETTNPVSIQNCSVEEAIAFGASGVGYVIHVGAQAEGQMVAEFSRIEKEAHERGLAVFVWMYITGDDLVHPQAADTLAYAARVGMELNADAIILPYSGTPESFRWVIKNAGRAKVFVVGGPRTDTTYQLLDTARVLAQSEAAGFAIGRNVWQAKDPLSVARHLAKELFMPEQ